MNSVIVMRAFTERASFRAGDALEERLDVRGTTQRRGQGSDGRDVLQGARGAATERLHANGRRRLSRPATLRARLAARHLESPSPPAPPLQWQRGSRVR